MNGETQRNYNKEISSTIIEAVTREVSKMNFIDKIDELFRAEYRELFHSLSKRNEILCDGLRKRNEILCDGITQIASMFDLDPSLWGSLDLEDMQKEITSLISALNKKAKKGIAPKTSMLVFSVNDDNGHGRACLVNKKDVDFVRTALSSHTYEGSPDILCEIMCDSEDSYILAAMEKRGLCKASEVIDRDYDVDGIEKLINKFFNDIVADKDVSLEEFSKCLECIVDTRRGSGDTNWVAL